MTKNVCVRFSRRSWRGSRSANPLIRVNCSVFPENLLESELFGHVRGAFTGAVKDRVGRFEAADGGTVFLDEIGDISASIQLKLLRFIEYKEFERVGDNKVIKTNARIIAATNADLGELVRQGAFREDFYYRLKVMNIHIPPLRERTEDIPLLVSRFCEMFSKSFQKNFKGVSDDVIDILLNYPWPGNVRELKHVIEHACILCPGGMITKKYLMPDLFGKPDMQPRFKLLDFKGPSRDDIEEALRTAGGNKAKAARILGISRSTIYRRISELGIPNIH